MSAGEIKRYFRRGRSQISGPQFAHFGLRTSWRLALGIISGSIHLWI